MSAKHLLKDFTLPRAVKKSDNAVSENIAVISMETFERGFATTIGNSLRRTLLSAIQGFAVTAARITLFTGGGKQRFITSEYDSIQNIKEDTIDVLDAIKRMKFIVDSEETTKFTLMGKCAGKGAFTMKIFDVPTGVTIVNPADVLLTATAEVDMLIELEVELGRGYAPSEENEKRVAEEGAIPLDALFSPIANVSYAVESVRVGHRSDYERLNIKIETNGTITPVDAAAQAAKILKDMLQPLINFDETVVAGIQELDTNTDELEKTLGISIDELEFSQRSSNCFRAANIRTLKELVAMSEKDVENLPNFGKKCMDEVKEKLKELNLSFGMEVS